MRAHAVSSLSAPCLQNSAREDLRRRASSAPPTRSLHPTARSVPKSSTCLLRIPNSSGINNTSRAVCGLPGDFPQLSSPVRHLIKQSIKPLQFDPGHGVHIRGQGSSKGFSRFRKNLQVIFSQLPASASAWADGRGFEPAPASPQRKTRSSRAKSAPPAMVKCSGCRLPAPSCAKQVEIL